MKFLITTLVSTFFIYSCAHHHKDIEHHHHKNCEQSCKLYHEKGEMFEKHCAQSVSEGDLHIKGSSDFKLKHSGQIYFFSSKDKLEKFKKHIESNSYKAQRNWERGGVNR